MDSAHSGVRVKVCGLTRLADVELCAEAGVDQIGLNFWPGSPRALTPATARPLVARAVELGLEVVAVVVDLTAPALEELRAESGVGWLQLHGEEPPELLAAVQPRAYKALGVANAADVLAATRYGGERILLDARVPGAMPGGTGVAFDWDLALELARSRALVLAGGLRPGNVAEAIRHVRPWAVDVASGVEVAPGIKDTALVRRFVAEVRAV